MAFGCVFLSHVSGRLKLVEVFAVGPLGVHSATGGRRVMRAHLVFWRSGVSGMGAHPVNKKSTIEGVLKNKRALVTRRLGDVLVERW